MVPHCHHDGTLAMAWCCLGQEGTPTMRFTGLVLMIIGILGLVVGGINYNRQRSVLEVGSMKATATEQRGVLPSHIVGGIVLLSGTLLFAHPGRRLA
jgi:hypothetical protein